MRSLRVPVLLLFAVGLTAAALILSSRQPSAIPAPSAIEPTSTNMPGITPVLDGVAKRTPAGITPVTVPNTVVESEVLVRRTARAEKVAGKLTTAWKPEPRSAEEIRKKLTKPRPAAQGPGAVPGPEEFRRLQERWSNRTATAASVAGAGTLLSFDSVDQFDSGAIPPDPMGAAGPNDVVNVVNSLVAFHDKSDGSLTVLTSLFDFFTDAVTGTFDPKVVYDPFEDRFVIITLEAFSPPLTSRFLIAVSDDSDPNGVWFQTAVPSLISIGGVVTFADYPGLAVDEEAIYLVSNQFGVSGEGFRDARIWAVAKGAGTGGLYDGGAATTKLLDPPDTFGAFGNFTLRPADILGTPPPGSIGTFFVAYNGLGDGTNEALNLLQLSNPVGAGPAILDIDSPELGDIDKFNHQDAPQAVAAVGLDVIGPRVLDAVWQDDVLTLTTVVVPPGGPNGETTAHWIQIDTSDLTTTGSTLVDQGDIHGDDIAPNTFTFFPAVSQAADGTLGFGFAASGTGLFPGTYYTFRQPADPAGTVRPSRLVRRGTGRYQRLDNGGRNRWGDYSGIGVDPAGSPDPQGTGQCFWTYNEYSANPAPTGPGSWATAWAQFCPAAAECGNATVELGETCDTTPGCRSNCTFCGDLAINVTETCEPPGGSCRDDCTACGDSIVQAIANEQCDDGNVNQGDGCDENCILEVCGNNIVQFGETCDPPGIPAGGLDECRSSCTFCSDTIVQPAEEDCDDGNNIDGDGCSSECVAGCGTARNFFSQTILATDADTLAWPSGVDIEWVEGDLSGISAYTFDASGSGPVETSLTWVTNPAPGTGRYKLVKVECPLTTWSSGGSNECEADPPGPGTLAPCRDIELP